jgi:uncharacterized membrane protein YesL
LRFLDSRFYGWLEAFTNFFLLSLLWLVVSLPVVTIFPSTAAMFGVVRGWVRNGEIGGLGEFFPKFRENLKGSLLLGLLWTILGATLALDVALVNQMPPTQRVIVGTLTFLAVLLYAFVSVYLFPVMVHYDTDWRGVLKNALLLSIGRLPTTLLCLLVVAVTAGVTVVFPLALVFTGSLTAYVVYRLCNRAFDKMAAAGERHQQR